MAKIEKGDICKIKATVARVWDDGTVTVVLHGFDTPITLKEKYLDEVSKPQKPAKVRVRKPVWPRHDEPD